MEYSADLKAFNQLFADYQGRFIRFANIYVRDIAVAEDFTIEALMQYWENRNTLKADSNVPAYILTIIKNKCINYLQHIQVREDASEHLKNHAEWEPPHLHPRSLQSGRTVYSRSTRNREQDIGLPAGTDPPYLHHESLRKQTLQRDRRNTRYDNQRRGIPYRPGSEKVTCQSERLHTSVGILILYELIRPFRPYTAVWLY